MLEPMQDFPEATGTGLFGLSDLPLEPKPENAAEALPGEHCSPEITENEGADHD